MLSRRSSSRIASPLTSMRAATPRSSSSTRRPAESSRRSTIRMYVSAAEWSCSGTISDAGSTSTSPIRFPSLSPVCEPRCIRRLPRLPTPGARRFGLHTYSSSTRCPLRIGSDLAGKCPRIVARCCRPPGTAADSAFWLCQPFIRDRTPECRERNLRRPLAARCASRWFRVRPTRSTSSPRRRGSSSWP